MLRITRSIVPNSLTLANLFSGFVALTYVAKENYILAGLFVLFAGLFDMVDGITARLVKSASELGVQLDSLSDAVSFGVVPSFMLYKIYFYQYGDLGLLISALPLICGVLRLARFNIQTNVFQDKKYFTGMAIPSSAFFILSYLLFYHNTDFLTPEVKEYLIFIVTFVASLSMVSTVKFMNAPRPNLRYIREHPFVTIFFLIAIVLSFATSGLFIFPFFVFYIIGSFVRHYYIRFSKR
ncbi:MAG: CDP-diacylglycerol--serine O-phosphatidyltransferase [Candidatus Kapaibacteriota bacterium]|jgi:CDP-diacylglycerol--serine O-phosphatidyltransferase